MENVKLSIIRNNLYHSSQALVMLHYTLYQFLVIPMTSAADEKIAEIILGKNAVNISQNYFHNVDLRVYNETLRIFQQQSVKAK